MPFGHVTYGSCVLNQQKASKTARLPTFTMKIPGLRWPCQMKIAEEGPTAVALQMDVTHTWDVPGHRDGFVDGSMVNGSMGYLYL